MFSFNLHSNSAFNLQHILHKTHQKYEFPNCRYFSISDRLSVSFIETNTSITDFENQGLRPSKADYVTATRRILRNLQVWSPFPQICNIYADQLGDFCSLTMVDEAGARAGDLDFFKCK